MFETLQYNYIPKSEHFQQYSTLVNRGIEEYNDYCETMNHLDAVYYEEDYM